MGSEAQEIKVRPDRLEEIRKRAKSSDARWLVSEVDNLRQLVQHMAVYQLEIHSIVWGSGMNQGDVRPRLQELMNERKEE